MKSTDYFRYNISTHAKYTYKVGCARLPLCINYICQLQAAGFAVVVIRWIHPSDPEEVRCAQMVQLSPQNRVDRVSVRALPCTVKVLPTFVVTNGRRKHAWQR